MLKDGLVVYCVEFVVRLKKACSDCWFGGVGGIMLLLSLSGNLNLSRFLGFGGVAMVSLGSCCAC